MRIRSSADNIIRFMSSHHRDKPTEENGAQIRLDIRRRVHDYHSEIISGKRGSAQGDASIPRSSVYHIYLRLLTGTTTVTPITPRQLMKLCAPVRVTVGCGAKRLYEVAHVPEGRSLENLGAPAFLSSIAENILRGPLAQMISMSSLMYGRQSKLIRTCHLKRSCLSCNSEES